MTKAEQFVKNIYPIAFAKEYYMFGWIIVGGFDMNKWDTQSKTANGAWKNASKMIQANMLKILENI